MKKSRYTEQQFAFALKPAELGTPAKPMARQINEAWSRDFVSDAFYDGKRFRTLTVLDNFTRACLSPHVDVSIQGEPVVAVLEGICAVRGLAASIRVDKGPEFISTVLDKWADEHGVSLNFSRPGKPTEKALIESFNGRFREECLNGNWFLSREDARCKIEAWRADDNEARPHRALNWQPPAAFARRARAEKEHPLSEQPDFSTLKWS